jgi:hypothetical protein
LGIDGFAYSIRRSSTVEKTAATSPYESAAAPVRSYARFV